MRTSVATGVPPVFPRAASVRGAGIRSPAGIGTFTAVAFGDVTETWCNHVATNVSRNNGKNAGLKSPPRRHSSRSGVRVMPSTMPIMARELTSELPP